ncbi:MAG: hypothetical protein AABY40_01985 [Nanoarchaeota archaeon]
MRQLQIGVMGSAQDLDYSVGLERLAERIGELIAENNCILLFGAEKDYDSLSTAACRGTKRKNGLAIGITYNKGKDIFEKDADVIISTGLDRGGGREFVLTLSCDVIIALNGGSGTLTEIAIAYQANIPVIVLEGTGGWADKLANKYLDERKRQKIYSAKTPEEAVTLALFLSQENLNKEMDIRRY